VLTDGFNGREQLVHFCTRAIQLDDQHGIGIRKARVDRGFCRLDRQAVHHLDRRGHDAGPDDRRDRRARLVDRTEAGEERDHRLGPPENPDDCLGHDRERALRADDRREQIESRRIEHLAAKVYQLSIREHGFHAEHVMDRESVLQAMGAARVLGDVAAN